MPPSDAPASDAEVATQLRAILASEEFQPLFGERAFQELSEAWQRVLNWFEQAGPFMRLLVAAGCVSLLVALAYLLLAAYRQAQGPRLHSASAASRRASPATALTPQALLERAHSLAEAGALRDAARALTQAFLLDACREQNVPWRSAFSDGEWLGLLRPSAAAVTFTRATQRLAFGPAPSRAEFDVRARELSALLAESARQPAAPGAAR